MNIPREFKYVIIDDFYPIVFSLANKHSDFGNMGKVTSAGFGQISENKVSVWGESHSLKIKSNQTDSGILQRLFFESLY